MITCPYHARWWAPIFLKEYFYQKILLKGACNPVEETMGKITDALKTGVNATIEVTPWYVSHRLPEIGKLVDGGVRGIMVTNHRRTDDTLEQSYRLAEKYREKILSGELWVAPHLICDGESRYGTERNLKRIRKNGLIDTVVALRGDGRKQDDGSHVFTPLPEGHAHANELIRQIKDYDKGLCVLAACYPEGHHPGETLEENLYYTMLKEEAGADGFVTQVFYDVSKFVDYQRSARRYGIKSEIIPMISPILSRRQLERFSEFSNVPSTLAMRIEESGDDGAAAAAGLEHFRRLDSELMDVADTTWRHWSLAGGARAYQMPLENLQARMF